MLQVSKLHFTANKDKHKNFENKIFAPLYCINGAIYV